MVCERVEKTSRRAARAKGAGRRSSNTRSPHVLGIDDAPFEKRQSGPVPIVGVMMEGATVVESVVIGAFPVDGSDATAYLSGWIAGVRFVRAVQAVMLGGVTIAGLGVVDVNRLSRELERPVLVVTRRSPSGSDLERALLAAGLTDRVPILRRSPALAPVSEGLFLAHAGVTPEEAKHLVAATVGKARVPEPLRVAHLIARALVLGESRGRV
jgi:endonuclease V-like protein UPF0215 family